MMMIVGQSFIMIFILNKGISGPLFPSRDPLHTVPILKLEILVVNRSASRLALTYGELNPSAPLNRQLLLTVSFAPGANLWRVKPFSALERSASFTVSFAPGANFG